MEGKLQIGCNVCEKNKEKIKISLGSSADTIDLPG